MARKRENNFVQTYKFIADERAKREEKAEQKVIKEQQQKQDFVNEYYNIIDSRDQKLREHSKLLESCRDDAFSTAIKAIYITALEAGRLTDDTLILAESMVDNWVKENGGAKAILNKSKHRNYLLSRISQIVDEVAEEETEEIEAIENDDDDENDTTPAATEEPESGEDTELDLAIEVIKKKYNLDEDQIKDALDKAEDESPDSGAGNVPAEDENIEGSSDDNDEGEEVEVSDTEEEITDDNGDEEEVDDTEVEEEPADDNSDSEYVDDEEKDKQEEEEQPTEDEAEESEDEEEVADDQSSGDDSLGDIGIEDMEDDEEESEDVPDTATDEDDEEEEVSDTEEEEISDNDNGDDGEEEVSDTEEEDIEDDDNSETDDANDIVDDLDKEELTIDGEPENKGKVFDELEKEPDVQKAIQTIRQRVADAEENFIKRNEEDKKEIDDLVNRISDNVKTVEKINDKDDKDSMAAQENARMYDRRVKDIREANDNTVFGNIVRNLSKSILKDQALRESYTDEDTNQVDFGRIYESAVAMYGFLETINTLKLENVDRQYIKEVLESI